MKLIPNYLQLPRSVEKNNSETDDVEIDRVTLSAQAGFVNLPAGQQIVVTVEKPGYTGQEQALTLGQNGSSNQGSLTMTHGGGGPKCPGAVHAPPPPPPHHLR